MDFAIIALANPGHMFSLAPPLPLSQIETVFDAETDPVELADAVLEVLDGFVISEHDLQRYWQQRVKHGQCLKLVETPTYNIVLNLWLPGQGSVVHDHDGSACFMKVHAEKKGACGGGTCGACPPPPFPRAALVGHWKLSQGRSVALLL